MATDIELALMAGRAYQSTRKDINGFPTPQDWKIIGHDEQDSGFEAISFQRGDEIVISFAGTYDKSAADIMADISLAKGDGSVQLTQAVEYYLQVKAQVEAIDPNATITLTGHSLGGGLAALVGVFFGVKAVTFDQAPFANSAELGMWPVVDLLKSELLLKGYSETQLSGLTNFIEKRAENGGIPNSNLVSNIRVDGEFLSSAPISLFDTIGTPATVLTHGPYSDPSIDMHSISLLTAFLQNDQFREVTTKLTDLLGMLFDEVLFAHTTDPSNTTDVNFLEHLVRHQEGLNPAVANDGDHMLDRFTTDLWKIAQEGGLTMANNDLTKALTAFAMQAYYHNRIAADATLIESVSGGIRFDRSDVADTLDAIKGYDLYFKNYLQTLPAEDRPFIEALLPNLLDWFIQAGSGGMTASAGDQAAFMLGGCQDSLAADDPGRPVEGTDPGRGYS